MYNVLFQPNCQIFIKSCERGNIMRTINQKLKVLQPGKLHSLMDDVDDLIMTYG